MEVGSGKTKGSDCEYVFDMRSYEAACRDEPDLEKFDRVIHDRIRGALNTLATGVDVQSIREVLIAQFEMNRDVVKLVVDVVESKEDICNNKKLSSLVKEYLENSTETLEFYGVLENCLERARKNQLIIQRAVQKFEEEVQDGEEGRKFEEILDELNKFKAAEKPFGVEFLELFRSVIEQQDLFLRKMKMKKTKLDKKLKWVKRWRKLSNVLFVSVFVSVVVFSVVAAAIAAPPVITAVAGALVVPAGSMGKWCNWLLNRYEKKLDWEKGLYRSMQTYITIEDMKTIDVLVEKMKTEIELLLYPVDFVVREQEAVKRVIDEIKIKLEVYMKTTGDLGKRADECRSEIRRASTVILRKISEPSSQSQL
ncbi:hypothetical protein SLEP1_g55613 [Rubroshorea leprosula]|uniref:Uncharacterized protein n=1 Tax=Rubroshorea leprosula TaxID=152421 RepID=A0AAV5MK46_9ROSI|nr:hypothetical protein SLEP1_g55613 [Rubroshorea leprosula]